MGIGGSASGGGISNTGGAGGPSLAIAPDNTPYVAWTDSSSGNNEIYLRYWNGSIWTELGGSASGGGISNNNGQSGTPSLAIAPDGTPYVAWQDDNSGNKEIYVRHWNGSTWAEVEAGSASGGGISNNSGQSLSPSLAIAPDGTPYVAWEDSSSGSGYEIYVRRWGGGGPGSTYAISGRATDSDNNPISGVTISDGAGHTTPTGSDGNYTLSGLTAGSYTITPSKNDYTFSPPSRPVNLPPDATGVDFVGTVLGGGGIFIDSGQTLGSADTYGVAVGDLDGDGDPDAFTANNGQADKVWLNEGGMQGGPPGHFTDSGQSLGNLSSQLVALGDLDGDGDLDAFVTTMGGAANKAWLNEGGGKAVD